MPVALRERTAVFAGRGAVEVEPFYFGAAGRELFGIYHPPEGMPKEEGVVICPPLFAEYLRSHACLRRLAMALSSNGLHVLRFDYFGTGDSYGELHATTSDDWQADIATAVAELQAVAGARRIRLVGVRLGATLAARAALDLPAVRRVVLWDPVVEGAAYLRQLRATHQRLLQAHSPAIAREMAQCDDAELVGFRVSSLMLERIAELALPPFYELVAARGLSAFVALSAEDFGYEPLVSHAESQRVPVARVDFDCNWTTHTEAVLFPHDIVRVLAEET